MKIGVIGTRGIPDIQGGIETHCEELYPRLVDLGCEVILFRRSCYFNQNNKIKSYKGIELKDVCTIKQKNLETLLHTFLTIFYAKRAKVDILHIHAIGSSVLIPLARLLGLKVVVTHHGQDYNRQKWGKLAKIVLKTGEYISAKYANELIVISEEINSIIKQEYKRFNTNLIYNGVNVPEKSNDTSYIKSLNLEPKKYIFTLGRFVEEKGFDGLIKAFDKLNNTGYKLVIAGDEDYSTKYSTGLKQLAKEKNVILTGFLKGEKLNELFSHAQLFVLPSFHEGLPIALLEAMSYNLDVLASDIPANREVKLPENCYFTCGDWDNLCFKLTEKLTEKEVPAYNLSSYNWNNIAVKTLDVYKKTVYLHFDFNLK